MSIMAVTSRVTHNSLMNKSKSELAYLYLDLCDINAKLNAAIMNQCGDNLCWFEPNGQKIPPRAEFLESCARYHAQIAGERGDLNGCKTIAQLEAELGEFRETLMKLRPAIVRLFGGMGPGSAIWSHGQYEKGYCAAIIAALTAFDAAIPSAHYPDLDKTSI